MSAVVLEIGGLSFGYRQEAPLFEDFSLTVAKGELVAVTGASGRGKSTLFELITGDLHPWRGTIRVARTASVFQDPYSSFHPSYSIRDQILDVAVDRDEIDRLAFRVGLTEGVLDHKPHTLSGGQLQRCSIVRALVMQPELILADEPTSALDNLIQLDVMKVLVSLLDRVGIVLITHDHALATWCADRIVTLDDANP